MSETITLTIGKDGTVESNLEGFSGKDCVNATADLYEKLGIKTEYEEKDTTPDVQVQVSVNQ